MEVRGSNQETAPRKTAENTIKYRDGGVGSVVANHRGGGESSMVVTTLQIIFLVIPRHQESRKVLTQLNKLQQMQVINISMSVSM